MLAPMLACLPLPTTLPMELSNDSVPLRQCHFDNYLGQNIEYNHTIPHSEVLYDDQMSKKLLSSYYRKGSLYPSSSKLPNVG